ncbi:MAG: nitronate monooxygenase [Bacteroidales bacterium]|nr:nitronate monooxygenase [Bacteroidales bacterium]
MNSFKIKDLEVKLPIIQGGMGIGVSLSGLASTVANEGGIGVIAAVGIGMKEPDYKKHVEAANKIALKKEIIKARSKTNGAIGVNILLALTDYDSLVNVAIEEGVDIVFVGAGLPLQMPANLEKYNTKFAPKISSPRAAKIIFNHWAEKYNRVPDAVVVEGSMCGGHVGFKKVDLINRSARPLIDIAAEVVREIDHFQQKFGIAIPVIAGGGIYTGSDMYKIMQVGVTAVKMGTRFVTTHESDVSIDFKQNYINCKEEDIVIIDSPLGLPGRVIRNAFVDEILAGKQRPVNCQWRCIKSCDFRNVPFCIAEALLNSTKGDFENGFSFAGSNAYRAKEIISVHETFEQIKQEYYQEKLFSESKAI